MNYNKQHGSLKNSASGSNFWEKSKLLRKNSQILFNFLKLISISNIL